MIYDIFLSQSDFEQTFEQIIPYPGLCIIKCERWMLLDECFHCSIHFCDHVQKSYYFVSASFTIQNVLHHLALTSFPII